MTALLPSAREVFVNPDGTPSRSFYSYLLQQTRDAGGSGDSLAQVELDVSTLAKRLGAEDGKPSSVSYPVFQFQGFTSLFAAQNGSVVSLSLQNDSAAPGNSYCYGTGTDGTKGWLPISQAIAGSSTITATVGADGVTTLTLPNVSVTSGGTLKKRAFDAQGRLSQEAAATTDDLSEGASNLYFTSARVLATTLTGLSTGTSTPVSATDSVLVGIGKLQAQVNTNATAISGKEPAIASGTTAQYWRGDKTWRDFATDVRAAVLTGLSTATSAVIAATDTVLGALGKLQAQITDNLLPQGYIDGLKMVWVSGTALTVTTGAAYIPILGKVLRVNSDIAKTGLVLPASTWCHVYLYSNAGAPDIELSTTAPDVPYNGTARTKSGDNTRRYLFSIITDASGNIANVIHLPGNTVLYRGSWTRVLSNGTATTATAVSLAATIPVTAVVARMKASNNSSATAFTIRAHNGSSFVPFTNIEIAPSGGFSFAILDVPATSSNGVQYNYLASPGTTGAYIDIAGYIFER
jgi:hypothetical protein